MWLWAASAPWAPPMAGSWCALTATATCSVPPTWCGPLHAVIASCAVARRGRPPGGSCPRRCPPERAERLVGAGCGSAVVAGAPTASLSDVKRGTRADGEARWVLPTGEPLTEQASGRSAVEAVPLVGCRARCWSPKPHIARAPSTSAWCWCAGRCWWTLRWATCPTRTMWPWFGGRAPPSVGVHLWTGPMSRPDAVWRDALSSGDAYALLPSGVVSAEGSRCSLNRTSTRRGGQTWTPAPSGGRLLPTTLRGRPWSWTEQALASSRRVIAVRTSRGRSTAPSRRGLRRRARPELARRRSEPGRGPHCPPPWWRSPAAPR